MPTVAWGSGTVYSTDGEYKYAIGSGDTGNMSAESIIYLDPGTSTTAFQVATATSYKENRRYVKIAKAKNQTAPISATFQTFNNVTLGGDQTGFVFMGANSIAQDSMTAVLSKKALQAWSSNLSFEATGTSGEYNKIKFGVFRHLFYAG